MSFYFSLLLLGKKIKTMGLFSSSNPVLSEKSFERNVGNQALTGHLMTSRGAMEKFGLLMLFVFAGAYFSWSYDPALSGSTMHTLMFGGMIVGFILALVMSFKPNLARILSPFYALAQGVFLGALSKVASVMATSIAVKKGLNPGIFDNIIMQAVGLTFGVALAMFLLYYFKVIKVTQRLYAVILSATMGVFVFYLITMIVRLFGVELPFMYDASPLGIGISLVVIAIAAMNLLLDFDRIEQYTANGAPKNMEWYCAFGLLVTIVWLYVEILRLLMRFIGNRN